jgi:ferritin-like metal-binding protein YciE
MANAESLQDLLVEELKDLFDAEKQITRALPKMAKKASSEELRAAFEEHLEVTEQQLERLTSVFEQLDLPARGKKCEGMQGLIEEAQSHMKELDRGPVLDAALIGAAQKVEHYEMAAYGTARTFASRLGHSEVASALEETLAEEKEADQKLTQIAEHMVNPEAVLEGESEEVPRQRRSVTASMPRSRAAERGGARRQTSQRRAGRR